MAPFFYAKKAECKRSGNAQLMIVKYKIAITFFVLGFVCLLSFYLIGSEVDEDGFLKEPFALIPLGWLLIVLGWIAFLVTFLCLPVRFFHGVFQGVFHGDKQFARADCQSRLPKQIARVATALMVSSVFLFLLNNYAIFWLDLPGIGATLEHLGFFDLGTKEIAPNTISPDKIMGAYAQLVLVLFAIFAAAMLVLKSPNRSLDQDAVLYSALAAYIVRGAFWAIFFIGLVDMTISFLRVEGLLEAVVGEHLNRQLGRPIFRGTYIHYPLLISGFVLALFTRTLGFIWLSGLIVVAEFLIVLTRFVFSYEQAFMGDLVRFWYAGLFLFASAYTLLCDGHVRVDVFYANFSARGRALTNAFGALFLGLPLMWIILLQGMAGKGSIINSPLLSFEISQSGFGMYTKYLMAGYLVIFAVSMLIQFTAFILSNLSILLSGHKHPPPSPHNNSSIIQT